MFLGSSIKLELETRIFIVGKDKDLLVKEDQSTKCILNTFLTITTQRAKKETSH